VKSNHSRNERHDPKDPEGAVCTCAACPVSRCTPSAPLKRVQRRGKIAAEVLHGYWNG